MYLDHLKWFQDLKTDPIHRNVMKTARKLMEEEDMDFEEAAEAAINKKKYLLNKIIKQIKYPKNRQPLMYLLTQAHRSKWSIGHQQQLSSEL